MKSDDQVDLCASSQSWIACHDKRRWRWALYLTNAMLDNAPCCAFLNLHAELASSLDWVQYTAPCDPFCDLQGKTSLLGWCHADPNTCLYHFEALNQASAIWKNQILGWCVHRMTTKTQFYKRTWTIKRRMSRLSVLRRNLNWINGWASRQKVDRD